MVKKKEDIPEWVTDEIQNAKFEKPDTLKRTGYILEIFDSDNKIDAQLYEPVEDGRHIVTLDLPKKIKSKDLERGVVYEFTFDSMKAPLSEKVVEFLQKEKEIEIPLMIHSHKGHYMDFDPKHILESNNNFYLHNFLKIH